jgi:hypothetical protein
LFNGLLEIKRGVGRSGPYELFVDGNSVGGERHADFTFPVNRFLPLIGEKRPGRGRPGETDRQARDFARKVFDQLEADLRAMRAIGPFRKAPSRDYEYAGRVSEIIDPAGDYVVNALIDDATRKRNPGVLLQEVNVWLGKVGRVRLSTVPLTTKRRARRFEVRARDARTGRWANFADVGFGIGQALPVLVEGLRTPLGGTFVVQEPEIHLHPDAQLVMADFLVGLVQSGRAVIAETHSEHILLRVRKAVVKTGGNGRSGGLRSDEVSCLLVQKDGHGISTVRAHFTLT